MWMGVWGHTDQLVYTGASEPWVWLEDISRSLSGAALWHCKTNKRSLIITRLIPGTSVFSLMGSWRLSVRNAMFGHGCCGWMCSVARGGTVVRLNTCGQLANVIAADVTVSLDSSPAPAWGFLLPLEGGAGDPDSGDKSMVAPHITRSTMRAETGQDRR